ncbi:MAG: Stage sporulation protein [Bacteroidota bacterium]
MKKFILLAISIYVIGFIAAIVLRNNFLIIKFTSLSVDFASSSDKSSKDLFFEILKNNTSVFLASLSGFLTLGLFTAIITFYNGFVLGYLLITLNRFSKSPAEFLPRLLPHSIEIGGFILASTLGFYLTNYITQHYFLKTRPKFDYLFFCLLFISGYIIILISAFIESYVSAT